MVIKFTRYGTKLYAETPQGEWAFGEYQGLYEWRAGERIDYTGADKQAAVNGGRLIMCATPGPKQRGIASALDMKTRMN